MEKILELDDNNFVRISNYYDDIRLLQDIDIICIDKAKIPEFIELLKEISKEGE